MKASKISNVVLLCISVFLFIIGLCSTFLGYRYGYCKSFDERVGASECKPSRKWL